MSKLYLAVESNRHDCPRGNLARSQASLAGLLENGYIGVIWGLYGDNGKENGNDYNGLYRYNCSLFSGWPSLQTQCQRVQRAYRLGFKDLGLGTLGN